MNVVVTGGSGHLGQWTIAALTAAGHEVTCVARRPLSRPTIGGLEWRAPVHELAVDLGDPRSVDGAASVLHDAEAVVHLAGHIPEDTARATAEDMDATLRANVRGTIGLLAALRDATKLQSFVYASTFEVYGAPLRLPVDEEHPTLPVGYYGASKLCGEKYSSLAGESTGFPCAIVRLPAVYGPGDTLRRAVGNFLRAAAESRPLEIAGDGADLRDLVYAGDAADAVLRVVESRANGVYNIANGRGHTIREIAETASSVAGGRTIVTGERVKPRVDYVLGIERAWRELGWEASTPLEDGLRAQLEWLRAR